MPTFEIKKNILVPLKMKKFSLEREIQSLTEKNLDVIFGLQFIETEFSIGEFRLDTVAFDKETESIVIIEYKKDQNFSVIDQGYAYLSLMLNRKADFVLLLNEKTGESYGKKDFDWSQSKILFIAPSFTSYQIEATNFQDLPIELWRISRYSNETVRYNKIRSQKVTATLNSVSKKNKSIQKITEEIIVYNDDTLLKDVENEIRDAYKLSKDLVYQVNSDVEEKIKKTMVCFYTGGRGLIWIKPNKKTLTFWLRKGKYKDKNGKVIPEGWGNYPEIHFQAEEIDSVFIKRLIEQANDYT